jgi:hypothetical protein
MIACVRLAASSLSYSFETPVVVSAARERDQRTTLC